MCGIAGFWGRPSEEDRLKRILTAMNDTLRHRGPDAQGIHASPQHGLGLAHTRLAIIDLSPAGAQPMQSPTGRYVIAYNGEAYNYMDVRRDLEAEGKAPSNGWRGHSDTEVLLAAIEAYGLCEALSRFVGMFAFALWDNQERTLTLVRDRLGIKPLYYGHAGDSLVFGSELKPLMAHPDFTRKVDRDALALYLRTLYVPTPYCMLEGVNKLEPGHFVTFAESDMAQRRLPAPSAFWSVKDAADAGLRHPFEGSENDAIDELERLLTDAVSLRTVSDVPLGAFLSGGIDSSTVTALLQRVSSSPVKTFTIGYEEGGYDEAAHAEAVAKHLGTDHTTLRLNPRDALTVIPNLPRFYDEPFADASQIPTYLVSELARKHVTVALSGDGGDELFGGYNRYTHAPSLWNKIGRLPLPARKAISACLGDSATKAIAAVYDAVSKITNPKNRQLIFQDKLQKVAASMTAADREAFFANLASYWINPWRFVHGARPKPTRFTDSRHWPPFADYERWMMAMDMQTYMPDDVLTKVDRASMAHALEARVPLIDHRVAEFSQRIPLRMKIRNGRGKWLLRQVLYRHVPQQIFDRPKQGFGIPIDDWLRGPLRDWAETLLSEQRLRQEGFFDPAPIRKRFEDHVAGRRNWQYHLWPVLMFQAWQEEYL